MEGPHMSGWLLEPGCVGTGVEKVLLYFLHLLFVRVFCGRELGGLDLLLSSEASLSLDPDL